MVMLAKGNRSQQVTDACKEHGGFYLGSAGGPAALLAKEHINQPGSRRLPRAGHGSRLENQRRKLPRLHPDR